MITREAAADYREQLHPAFAGYLHDGEISERDCLAIIFQLFAIGVLTPVWEDGSMGQSLQSVILTGKKTRFSFEKLFITVLFGDRKEMSAREVGNVIRQGTLQTILYDNVHAIRDFPIINKSLQFYIQDVPIEYTLNGQKVDTPERAKQMKYADLIVFIPIMIIFVAFFSILLYQETGGDIRKFSFQEYYIAIATLFMVLVFGMLSISPFFTRKKIAYDFEKKVVPVAKKKYDELFDFMQKNPLPQHTFVNEFLPFAIAFGLDTSWQKDFGISNQ